MESVNKSQCCAYETEEIIIMKTLRRYLIRAKTILLDFLDRLSLYAIKENRFVYAYLCGSGKYCLPFMTTHPIPYLIKLYMKRYDA